LEYQFVDRETRNLVPCAPEVLAELSASEWAKPKLFQSTIEINTCICTDVEAVRRDLGEKIRTVSDVAEKPATLWPWWTLSFKNAKRINLSWCDTSSLAEDCTAGLQ